jgi:putative RecB family exonuclease
MEEVDKSQIIEAPKPLLKLSASSTKTFDSCRRKYFYSYIDKQPKKHWDHLTLGTFCHAVLEAFHKQWLADKNLNLAQLIGSCFAEARTETEFLTMTDTQLNDAKVMIQDYLFLVEKNGMPNTLSVEEGFEITLGNYVLRGFIDRLDVDKDGLFHIVDYKTTKNEKYLDDFQLLVYGMAIKNKYPEIDRFRGSYVLLKKGSKMMTNEYNLSDIYKCEKKILEYGKSIEEEKKWEKSPSQLCNWCDFYDTCMGVGKWIGE